MIYHGLNEEYQWDSPYRKLMCAVIEQAVLHAQGLELNCEGRPTRLRESELQQSAFEYLLSDDFEDECMYLNLPPSFVEEVRNKIGDLPHQIPAFTSGEIIVTPKRSRKFGGQYAIDKFGKNSKSLFAIVKAAQAACAESQNKVNLVKQGE